MSKRRFWGLSREERRPITNNASIIRENEAILASIAPHIAHAIGRTKIFGLIRMSSDRGRIADDECGTPVLGHQRRGEKGQKSKSRNNEQ